MVILQLFFIIINMIMKRTRLKPVFAFWTLILYTYVSTSSATSKTYDYGSDSANATICSDLINFPKSGTCSCKNSVLRCRNVDLSTVHLGKRANTLTSISLKAVSGLRKLSNTFLTPLSTLPNVHILNISGCSDYIELDFGFFNLFPNLRVLKVSGSCLRQFPRLSSVHGYLEKLILNRNLIRSINPETLSLLPNLQHLELNQNRLTEILPEWIPQGSFLKHLYLRNNQLERLSPSLNTRLSNLETLVLSGNRFSGQLRTKVYGGDTGGSGPMGILSPNAPGGPGGLKAVDDIPINEGESYQDRIRRQAPPTASALRSARCPPLNGGRRNSRRREKAVGLLPVLENLVHLDLSRNCLTGLAPVTFMAFMRLGELRLARNRITNLGVGAFCNRKAGDLKSPSSTGLQRLDLSGNPGLRAVTTNWTFGLNHLRELHLSNCGFEVIQPKAFYELTWLTHLDLSYNRLPRFEGNPFSKLSSLRTLLLNSNRIADIQTPIFTGLERLKTLSLANNRLTSLQVETPRNFLAPHDDSDTPQNLENTGRARGRDSSGNNPLKEAPPPRPNESRAGERSEQKNRATTTVGLFSHLSRLENLNLSTNFFNSIKREDLEGIRLLNLLDLTGNPVSHLKTGVFCNLPRLQTLALDSNRLVCDCQLAETVVCLLKRSIKISGQCAHPVNLADKSPLSLSPSQLESLGNCGPLLETTVRLTSNANSSSDKSAAAGGGSSALINQLPAGPGPADWVLLGGNLTLECHVTYPEAVGVTTSSPPVFRWERVVVAGGGGMMDDSLGGPGVGGGDDLGIGGMGGLDWRTERIRVNKPGGRVRLVVPVGQVTREDASSSSTTRSGNSNSRTKRAQQPQRLVRWHSILEIGPMKVEDEGRYLCVVKTPSSIEKAAVSEIKVYSPPRFFITPLSVISVMEANTVEITCGASGRPRPTTALRKVGGSDFPAAKSRRIVVDKDDTPFYITKVRRADAGLYVCQSINQAGMIAYNFTLHVNTPAKFTLKPKPRQRIPVDRPLVITCSIAGYPPPRLVWLRNGLPLNTSDRIQLTDTAEMLVFKRVEPTDAAVYTATIDNALGVDVFNVTLDVFDRQGVVHLGSRLPDNDLSGGKNGDSNGNNSNNASSYNWLSNHLIGIIIIAVVLCVVLTSLLWVLALYCLSWRKQRARHHHHVLHHYAGVGATTTPGGLPASHTANSLLSSCTLSPHQQQQFISPEITQPDYRAYTDNYHHFLKTHQSVPSLAGMVGGPGGIPLLMGRSVDQLEMSMSPPRRLEDIPPSLSSSRDQQQHLQAAPPPPKSKSSGNIVAASKISSSDYFTGTSGSCESGSPATDDQLPSQRLEDNLPPPPPPPPPPHRTRLHGQHNASILHQNGSSVGRSTSRLRNPSSGVDSSATALREQQGMLNGGLDFSRPRHPYLVI